LCCIKGRVGVPVTDEPLLCIIGIEHHQTGSTTE
jgi:hypothetical protein